MINSLNDFNYEDVKKEINEENNLNNALDKDLEAVDEESYKSLPVLYPAYNTYNEKIKKFNNNISEDTIDFFYKKKHNVPYISFSKSDDYILPTGKCIGFTLLEKRKITGKTCISYMNYNNKKIAIFDNIEATPIGLIPTIKDNAADTVKRTDFIIVMRKKISIFTILMPIIFVRTLISIALKQ